MARLIHLPGHGLAEALGGRVVAEASVEAGAEVAAEQDLRIGGKKNCYLKGGLLCHEEMVRGLPVRDREQAGVEDAVRVKAEAGWAGLTPQGRVEVASAPVAAIRSLMLRDSPAMQRAVRNVVRK